MPRSEMGSLLAGIDAGVEISRRGSPSDVRRRRSKRRKARRGRVAFLPSVVPTPCLCVLASVHVDLFRALVARSRDDTLLNVRFFVDWFPSVGSFEFFDEEFIKECRRLFAGCWRRVSDFLCIFLDIFYLRINWNGRREGKGKRNEKVW